MSGNDEDRHQSELLRPVTQAERIVSIDVLRGFALLGILVVNVQAFSMIYAAYFNPTLYGDLSGANFGVWLITHCFFDQKYMTIFSMLFGAGMVLMSNRAEATGRSAATVHYRRMFWLIIFGLLHAHLFWYGDILVTYGLCGMLIFWTRRLRPAWLLTIGLALFATGAGISLLGGSSLPFWSEAELAEFVRQWSPSAEAINTEVEIYRSGWIGQMRHRVPTAFEFETFTFLVWGFWRAGGQMLIGAGLFKLGVFSAERSRRFYWGCVLAAVLVGFPAVGYGVYRNFQAGWDVRYTFFYGVQFNYWASLLVSLGYVGGVMLACQNELLPRLRKALAAVGQTALTNYLLQTVLCTTIFYGHGLGLFGQVERVGQLAIVIAIWILQLVISPLWLTHYRFGPVEWLWRSLTYGTLPPFRR